MMTSLRMKSIEKVATPRSVDMKANGRKVSDYYAENVFTDQAMKAYLSEDAYLSVMSATRAGQKIDMKIADQVASAMKSWAITKGATHFTHWFQPLTGTTAEKHDSFFTLKNGIGYTEFAGAVKTHGIAASDDGNPASEPLRNRLSEGRTPFSAFRR